MPMAFWRRFNMKIYIVTDGCYSEGATVRDVEQVLREQEIGDI